MHKVIGSKYTDIDANFVTLPVSIYGNQGILTSLRTETKIAHTVE